MRIKELSEFAADDGLALYSERPENSRGRIYPEHVSKTRNAFERDRDRIIYSEGFRRLKFKTQVFVYYEGDNYRTRLSHSIEVAQVARYLTRMFGCNEDLAEACALAHDLGHTPFAHTGEDALKVCMEPYGGFDHNDQTLRVVTKLENKYPHYRGLNLSWETLEGLIKHSGPIAKVTSDKITLGELKDQRDFMLDKYPSLEAQTAGIADDIAYNSHDLEDGLHAEMFTLDDLAQEVDWVKDIILDTREQYPNADHKIVVQETIREVMGTYAADVIHETTKRILEVKPKSADDIRNAGKEIVAMSDEMMAKNRQLKTFLYDCFYRHRHVSRMRFKTLRIVKELFATFMENSYFMPTEWSREIDRVPVGMTADNWKARIVADYIASMTDRFAIAEYKDLFNDYEAGK